MICLGNEYGRCGWLKLAISETDDFASTFAVAIRLRKLTRMSFNDSYFFTEERHSEDLILFSWVTRLKLRTP